MPKRKADPAQKLFLDDEDDEGNGIPDFPKSSLRVNEKYATSYDKWRHKEEFQKLKDRYGDVSIGGENEDEESSSDEDENPYEDLTPADERDFLKKLALIKTGAYRDYRSDSDDDATDNKIDDKKPSKSASSSKKTTKKLEKPSASPPKKRAKTEPMYLKDYERRLILERGGKLSDDEDEEDGFGDDGDLANRNSKTYVQEQREIKESFKSALKDDGEDDFLQARQKTAQEKAQEEEDYMQWLKGQKETVADEKVVKELKPLRDYWGNPNLDQGERFLRDYILNKRYVVDDEEEEGDNERIPSYDEIVHESDLDSDEAELDRQEQFEHKYNFRYEEPDAEFMKTYPRTVAESLRRKDDKRKLQRDDYKKRKEEEKKKQIEEVKQLKNMKRKEIMEKLEKLRRTAGLDDLPLDTKELEDDFNPEEYDRLMQKAFGDDYYATAGEDEQKPEFSDEDEDDGDHESANDEQPGEMDEDGDMANWDAWTGEKEADQDKPGSSKMANAIGKLKPEFGDKKKRKRSLFAQVLMKKKPVFNPSEKKFEEYFDEYYKMDFEDLIGGDVRCRFKYREVPPNDFGLSTKEILAAKDKELNSWVSVKKMSQYRTRDEEVYDQKAYKTKGNDGTKKRRLLLSIYGEKPENDDEIQYLSDRPVQFGNRTSSKTDQQKPDAIVQESDNKQEAKKKRKKRNKKKKKAAASAGASDQVQPTVISTPKNMEAKKDEGVKANKRKRTRKGKPTDGSNNTWERKTNLVEKLSNERLAAYGVNPKKLKNKMKYAKKK